MHPNKCAHNRDRRLHNIQESSMVSASMHSHDHGHRHGVGNLHAESVDQGRPHIGYSEFIAAKNANQGFGKCRSGSIIATLVGLGLLADISVGYFAIKEPLGQIFSNTQQQASDN